MSEESGPVPEQPDVHSEELHHEDFVADTGARRYEVTIYTEGLRIVGEASWSVDARSSSRRASDFLRSLPLDRITLGEPRIYDRVSGLVIDEPDFIMVNMQRINAIYAREKSED